MDEQVVTLLQQVVDELVTVSGHLDDVNRGIAMLLEKSDAEILDKLDDIAGGIGDINSKMGGSAELHRALDSIQSTLNELPGEIGAAVSPPTSRR
jgi:hypothetical protein